MPRTLNVVLAAAASCVALLALAQTLESAPLVPPFSGGQVGSALPQGWEVVPINERKKPTRYDLGTDGGAVVLHAVADAAATALAAPTRFDLRAAPFIHWRWKINHLIANADPRVGNREDSPVRIVLEFDGDKLNAAAPAFGALALA